MSGGNLDYFYSRFDEPLEKISKEIKWGKNKWSPEVLSEFQITLKYLKIAQVYSNDVEWLLSGDYGDDSFLESIKEELEELEKNPDIIELQLKKSPLCKNFNGTTCKHRFDLSYRYVDNPEWEELGRKSYEKRLTDASDCCDFEEIKQ